MTITSDETTGSRDEPTSTGAVCAVRSLVDRHFEGTILPVDERRLRDHLASCEACRDRYERHLIFASLDPHVLPAEERIARGLGLRDVKPRAWLGATSYASFLVVAAAAVVLLVVPPARVEDQFTARGSQHGTELVTSPSIGVYRISAGPPRSAHPDREGGVASPSTSASRPSEPMLAARVIDRQDELAFTYQSHDETKTHLMIFGLDERGRVYWFHPEWTVETDNPKAIRIESDGRPHDLREAIRHRFDGVRLEIHGLFLDRPASVRDVEEQLGRRNPASPLTMAGASDHVSVFELTDGRHE